jgi:NAD(P)H-hydrate epimerase
MRILTAEAMRRVDREAIDGFGIPSLVLMENAALGVVDAVAAEYPDADAVTIFCGPGNNGGDGLAVGRHLAVRGYGVTLFLVAGGRELRGDAAIQLGICRGMGLDLREVELEESIAGLLEVAGAGDVVIDCLFGTGLIRPLSGQYAELVTGLNEIAVPRLAADLPSGLSGSRPDVFGPTLEADLTVTFGVPKIPHVFPPAAALVGRVVVADLGIPPELLERAEGDLHLLTEEVLAPLLASRPIDSHKGDYGHVLVVGGSEGKSGAAVLTARGAVRSGAGLVTIACPVSILPTVEATSIESMAVALPTSSSDLGDEAVAVALAASEGKSFLAIGPGLGVAGKTPAAVRNLVMQVRSPVVLDADGLNCFAGLIDELSGRREETILTPHAGELGRLMGISTDAVLADRVAAVRRASEASGAVVVLKGHLSLIADPRGGIYVNPTGNPGMATGGSGDVLTGMIAGLGAQGHEPLDAARLGVFLHGLAGDLAAGTVGETGLTAGDLVERVPEAIERLGRS